MEDWKKALAKDFGGTVPAPEPEPDTLPVGTRDPEFDPDSHLASPWLERLRALDRAKGKSLGRTPKLAAARQRHAAVVKALKQAGQQRDAKSLDKLRDQYLKQRSDQAWSVVKARFARSDLSDKAYRGLKQGKADPEQVLDRLRALGPEAATMGAKRLRQALEG